MEPTILILIFGGGIAVFLLIIGLVTEARYERKTVEERLGRYLEKQPDNVAAGPRERSTPIGDWLEKRLEKTSRGGGISRELARADLKLKPVEYIATILISMVLTAVVFWFFMDRGNQVPFFTIIGAIVGLFLPRMYVKRLQTKRIRLFDSQLADMLNLMVNGLRAGYSNLQAMEAVSREMPSPICDEFRRVVQEIQIGLTMEEALENLLRRIPSPDLDLVVTAMNVQREVGGNLAEILDTISYTIRERVRIKGEIRVLTSQVMYSGRFLALMPLLIAGVLWLVNRPYMMQFFNPETRLVGIIALVISGLMIMSGYFVMTRIANIDI
jgi:tight adherence protein B